MSRHLKRPRSKKTHEESERTVKGLQERLAGLEEELGVAQDQKDHYKQLHENAKQESKLKALELKVLEGDFINERSVKTKLEGKLQATREDLKAAKDGYGFSDLVRALQAEQEKGRRERAASELSLKRLHDLVESSTQRATKAEEEVEVWKVLLLDVEECSQQLGALAGDGSKKESLEKGEGGLTQEKLKGILQSMHAIKSRLEAEVQERGAAEHALEEAQTLLEEAEKGKQTEMEARAVTGRVLKETQSKLAESEQGRMLEAEGRVAADCTLAQVRKELAEVEAGRYTEAERRVAAEQRLQEFQGKLAELEASRKFELEGRLVSERELERLREELKEVTASRASETEARVAAEQEVKRVQGELAHSEAIKALENEERTAVERELGRVQEELAIVEASKTSELEEKQQPVERRLAEIQKQVQELEAGAMEGQVAEQKLKEAEQELAGFVAGTAPEVVGKSSEAIGALPTSTERSQALATESESLRLELEVAERKVEAAMRELSDMECQRDQEKARATELHREVQRIRAAAQCDMQKVWQMFTLEINKERAARVQVESGTVLKAVHDSLLLEVQTRLRAEEEAKCVLEKRLEDMQRVSKSGYTELLANVDWLHKNCTQFCKSLEVASLRINATLQ